MEVIPKNEQYVAEMVDILEIIHQFVPEVKMEPDEEPVLCPIAMGGDQLTIARSRTAQEVRVTDKSSKQALRGTMFFCWRLACSS